MTFWLISGLLVVLAVVFLIWPFLRGTRAVADPASRSEDVRALYRDRLAELERETASGQIDSETQATVAEELGANLLEEYQEASRAAQQAAQQTPPAGRRSAAWLAALLVCGLGTAVYFSAGEPGAGDLVGASSVLRLDPQTQRGEIESWAGRFDRRVQRRPEDAQSWYLLGVSRLQLGEFAAAERAFANAHELVADDANIDLYWLQARYLAAGGELDEGSRAIARRILQARPNHPLVLEMFAIEAYRQERFRDAVEYLNQALSNSLPASQLQALLGGLREARSRLGDLTPSVDVSVNAPPGAPGNATLFVIARPPGGGMPYAVVRRPATLLPLTVRLDDTTGMGPGTRLSDAGEVEIVVRLSPSGDPAPSPGDWEWRSPVVRLADQSAPLELNAALQPRGTAG